MPIARVPGRSLQLTVSPSRPLPPLAIASIFKQMHARAASIQHLCHVMLCLSSVSFSFFLIHTCLSSSSYILGTLVHRIDVRHRRLIGELWTASTTGTRYGTWPSPRKDYIHVAMRPPLILTVFHFFLVFRAWSKNYHSTPRRRPCLTSSSHDPPFSFFIRSYNSWMKIWSEDPVETNPRS